jgi:hypothetical protein
VGGGERREPPRRLLELPLARDAASGHPGVVPRDRNVDEPLEEVALLGGRGAPRFLERLVRRKVLLATQQVETLLVRRLDARAHGPARLAEPRFQAVPCYAPPAVATILVAGVDLFFRGKLDALLGRNHKLTTTDSVDRPDLVIVDIARVDPEEVAEEYPDVPILGFTNHTDTAGLRAAQAAGFDRVVVRSALAERAPELVEELVA